MNQDKGEKVTAPKDLVRTDATDQKLDKFLVKAESGRSSSSGDTPEFRECKLSSVKLLRQEFQVNTG